jgi:hypothetical protein
MARGGVNKAVVLKARNALLARGEHPSIDAVRIEMGNTGSKTTIHRYLKELDQGDLTPPSINDELAELVARLAQRLNEQADERVDQAQVAHNAALEKLHLELTATQRHAAEQQARLETLNQTLEQQAATLLYTEQTLAREQTDNVRLAQANQDLETRLADKAEQIRSLEDKHQHAREALEHYRNSIKDQRDQEQRRHESQVQQLQMELRQAQQSLIVSREDITQLNRDNERLLAESRASQRELIAQRELLNKATTDAGEATRQQQHSQTQCALLEERLRAALDESATLKKAVIEGQQHNRMLELLLIKKEVALEALQKPVETPEPSQPGLSAQPAGATKPTRRKS